MEMNDLSWLIYFAGIAGNIQSAFTLITVFGGFGMVVIIAMCIIAIDLRKMPWWGGGGVGLFTFLVWLCFLAGAVLTPDKQTIYLIAGSEIGETVVKTPEAKELMTDIHEVIKFQLGKLKGE